jgi:hypothetical protein
MAVNKPKSKTMKTMKRSTKIEIGTTAAFLVMIAGVILIALSMNY